MSDEPIIVAPAVHTDKLWDVDKLPEGCLTNVDAEPINAKDMTKAEFFALLNARGLRMKNQQESVTGPEMVDLEALAIEEAAKLAALQVIVPPAPFTTHEAEIFQAHQAVLARYGLIETLGCDVCWQGNRGSGTRTRVDAVGVRVECRCGVREYRAPTGTTDQTMTLSRPTENDKTSGMLFDAQGRPTSLPTVLMTRQDAEIIRAYRHLLHTRRLSRSLFCRLCYGGRPSEENAIHESVTDDQVVYCCLCRIRFGQTT